MTKIDFITGTPFTIFGISGNLHFDAKANEICQQIRESVYRTTIVIIEDYYFTACLRVFGIDQRVSIPYSYCEEK